jgi:hypothetical protein
LQVDPHARPRDYGIQAIISSTSTQKKKKHKIQTKEFYSLKEPRYNLRLLASVMEDVLHVYSAHDGGCDGGKATDQLRPTSMDREPRCHLMEVLASAELQGSEGNTGSQLDSGHHRAFMFLH